jgi:hypothetical protein
LSSGDDDLSPPWLGGLAAMLVAVGWCVLLVELWPADNRPYIGGLKNNSFLDLTFGYNG